MLQLRVHDQGKITCLQAVEGDMLFTVLRGGGFQVYSPCGGKGTCGKCLVHVKGYGEVTSCRFPVETSLDVILPFRKEARILTDQHALTIETDLQPGHAAALSDRPFGLAVDLGTTTLVFYLVDLLTGTLVETRSMLNPQAVYGQDVISRILHATTEKGLEEMQGAVTGAIRSQATLLLQQHHMPVENLTRIVVAGNNTMLHLLLGVDPSSMGQAPYTPMFTALQVKKARDLDLPGHERAEVILLPSVSAFVGSDIVAGLASIRFSPQGNCLFTDLGTNGELALVTPEHIWCCATAAGPVFEGASISCGIGGVDGAIAEFSAEGPVVIGDEKPAGICGSGLVDVIAFLLDKGIIDPTGLMEKDYEVVPAEGSATGRPIYVSPEDVRQVQLAKSAIATGIRLLLKQAGLGLEDIDIVYLAGGFGNYLNTDSAMRLGLLPAPLRGRIVSLGNTAGTGALLALRSEPFLEVLETVIRRSRHIELSEDPDFALEFAMNMEFPAGDQKL